MRKYFAKYLQQRREHWAARQYVNANDDRAALDAMFLLNHMAKGSSMGRETIYALKNCLVRNLYERGFCVSATLHQQVFICWRCDGTGVDPYGGWDEWDDPNCTKCDGTGIYREHTLYQFVFRVCGKTYVWHQPKQYVNWPVTLTDEEVKPFQEVDKRDSLSLPYDLMVIYGFVVRAYLLKHGVSRHDVPHLYGFREIAHDIIRDKWRNSRWAFEWKQLRKQMKTIRQNGRRLLVFLQTGKMPEEKPEWDSPF